MKIMHTIRASMSETFAKVAKKYGFSDGLINLILREAKEHSFDDKTYKQKLDFLQEIVTNHIKVMKQTNINQADFLLDVYERFGKDSQSAIDFVRHNMAGLIENPETKKNVDLGSESVSEPKAIDLGLPSGTLWCDRSVGAKSPYDYGAFFSWGNTEPHYPKSEMDWGDDDEAFDYKFNSENYKKTPGYKLEGDIDAEHDAATVILGEPWRLPTKDDFQELYANCDWVRKTVNGVNGYLVTSKKNGNSIFFACSGYGNGSSWVNRGSSGGYWSASFYSAVGARGLHFYSGGVNPQNTNYRCYGFAVRPVQTSINQTK